MWEAWEACFSYIHSPDGRKKKKATINPKNEDDKCFQYAVTFALKYGEIELHSEIVLNIRPFINEYNWEEVNYPPKEMIGKHLKK